MTYLPTLASVRQHPLPRRFDDAKLGIFIHPWQRAAGITDTGRKVRFTRRGDTLFAIALEQERQGPLVLDSPAVAEATIVRLVSSDRRLAWRQEGSHLVVRLPSGVERTPAVARRIGSEPRWAPDRWRAFRTLAGREYLRDVRFRIGSN